MLCKCSGKYIDIYFILKITYWSEVNIIIIKPQFDILHHQEEKALKKTGGGGDLSMFKM